MSQALRTMAVPLSVVSEKRIWNVSPNPWSPLEITSSRCRRSFTERVRENMLIFSRNSERRCEDARLVTTFAVSRIQYVFLQLLA
jgi:hypothetical protein